MSYTIAVPISSIQKAISYGANVSIIGTGVQYADGTTVTSAYPTQSFSDPAFNQANTATSIAQASYNFANTIAISSGSVDLYARSQAANAISNTVIIQGVDLKQNNWISSNVSYFQGIANSHNTAIVIIQGINDTQNSLISIIQGVDLYQNTQIVAIQNINNDQYNQIYATQGVDLSQNTNISSTDVKMQSAYIQANTARGIAQASFDTANSLVISGGVIDIFA